jgi:hypothetical protein
MFPSMTQYGWCFVVDVKNDKRRGWVPGSSYVPSVFYFEKHCHVRHSPSEEYGLPSNYLRIVRLMRYCDVIMMKLLGLVCRQLHH